MRHQTVLLACMCSAFAVISAIPLPASNQELDVLQIPLNNGKELDVLTLGTAEQLADRNKRTIGLLRDLFPDITKQIDDQANRIIAKILRVLGPTVLRTAIQGNSANRARTDFDADFDDDDDDSSSSSSSGSSSSGTRVSIELPTFSPEDSDEDNETFSDKSSTTPATSSANQSADGASIDLEALNKQLEETIRVARQASEAGGADAEQKLTLTNEVQGSSSSSSGGNDQQTAESKSSAIDELNLDSNEDAADADDRNKRFLTFGGSSTNGGDASASKGNSGNFLFDIIRLFSGSVQTQTSDEASNSPSSSSQTSGDSDSNDTDSSRNETGYTEGIPGPVTRFVVLANRGLANLIQDLILRIAATSERLVNFKARLITALI